MLGNHLSNEEKLDEIYKLTEQNNNILRSMRRGQYIANFFRLIYWIVIIVSLGGVYLLVKPFMGALNNGSASGLEHTVQQISDLKNNISELKALQAVLGNTNQTSQTPTEGQ